MCTSGIFNIRPLRKYSLYIAINSQVHLHETSDSLDIVLIEAPVIKLVSDILSQDGYNISAHVLYYIDIIMSMKP